MPNAYRGGEGTRVESGAPRTVKSIIPIIGKAKRPPDANPGLIPKGPPSPQNPAFGGTRMNPNVDQDGNEIIKNTPKKTTGGRG